MLTFNRLIFKDIGQWTKEVYIHYLTLVMLSRYKKVQNLTYEYLNSGCYFELFKYSPM